LEKAEFKSGGRKPPDFFVFSRIIHLRNPESAAMLGFHEGSICNAVLCRRQGLLMNARNHHAVRNQPFMVQALLLAVGWAHLVIPPVVLGGETNEIVAVYSSVSPAYIRPVLADGTRKAETYAFGEGGDLGGAQRDNTIDRLGFIDIVRLLAPALAKENYRPCNPTDPRQAGLLVMVYWGTTTGTDGTSSSPQYQIAQALIPPSRAALSPPPNGLGGTAMASDPSTSGRAGENQVLSAIKAADDSAQQQSLLLTAMANRQRDKQNMENAAILGFLTELKRVEHDTMTALAQRRQDVIDEVEESRYYVVLMAYDFQILLQKKQRKLLWETRFSIPQHRNDFSKQLAAMAQSASRYFGQNSQGLVRQSLREGHVNLGELKILGVEPEGK
jgi:hypothetical protein